MLVNLTDVFTNEGQVQELTVSYEAEESPAETTSFREIPSQSHNLFAPLALSAISETICKQFSSIKYRMHSSC